MKIIIDRKKSTIVEQNIGKIFKMFMSITTIPAVVLEQFNKEKSQILYQYQN